MDYEGIKWIRKNDKRLRLIAFAVLFLVLFPRLRSLSIENIVDFAQASMPLSIITFIVIYSFKAVVMVIPITMLYIAAGIVFPIGWAIAITYLGLTAALSVGYFIGRILGKDTAYKIVSERKNVKNFLFGSGDNITSLCFMARVLPVPFDLISIFCGAFGMPYFKYIAVSLLGKSPFMIPCIISWTFISNPLSIEFLVPFSLSFLITIAVFLIYRVQSKKRLKICEVKCLSEVRLFD